MHFKAIDYFSKLFNTGNLYKRAGNPIIMPMYHAVGYSEELTYLKNLYNVIDEVTFEQDLDKLLKSYTPIDLFQLINLYERGFPKDNKKYMFLSFDDGLRCCYDTIYPILKSKGIPATFFLNADFIDNKKMFHRFKSTVIFNTLAKREKKSFIIKEIEQTASKQIHNDFELLNTLLSFRYTSNNILDSIAKSAGVNFNDFLIANTPYMSSSQIKELKKNGFTFGAHSMDHPEYYLLSENDQLQQTVDSMQYLLTNFDLDYKVFAFPFTDIGVNKTFYQKINNEHGFTLTFGGSGIKKDAVLSNLHRIPMDVTHMNAKDYVRSELLHYNLKKRIGKHIVARN